MLSLRNVLLLVLALVFATGTALYVKSWLENERALIAANQKTNVQIVKQAAAEVLVAKTDMPAGTFIKSELVRWQAWPEDGVHDSHIVKVSAEDRDKDYEDPVKALDGVDLNVAEGEGRDGDVHHRQGLAPLEV